ncbi:hypothetical protein [Cupriavidus sp. AU9028]|uniref:hypothetical protein n=1 Tax=Cupriavidus sp. AU9028 TaxID=2871157 RepID=UPI001C9462F5|nr:hypothetical protein [Cupriavidus sp. AU9028]MBY4898435.1 hypothetical protein [Cupriavidus sp. AU9028]
MSQASTSVHRVLADGALRGVRLAARIHWMVTPGGFIGLAGEVERLPQDQRDALMRLMIEHQRTMHPSMQMGVEKFLSERPEFGGNPGWEFELERWRRGAPAPWSVVPRARIPPLAAVLALGASERGPLLARWLDATGDTGANERSVHEWQAICAALPEQDAALLWAALLNQTSDAVPERWTAIVQEGLDLASRMLADKKTRHAPNCHGLLEALAHAVGDENAYSACGPAQRRPVWQALLLQCRNLPEVRRRALFPALAAYPLFELRHGGPESAPQEEAAWLQMCAVMLPQASAEEAADLLSALLEQAPDADSEPPAGFVREILATGADLPPPGRARLLRAAVVHSDGLRAEEVAALWSAAFQACEQMPSDVQPPLLEALASTFTDSLLRRDPAVPRELVWPSRWLAVLGQTARLAPDQRFAPALALANSLIEADHVEECATRLLALAASLNDAERAQVLAAMASHDYAFTSPRLWADLVNQVVALPGPVRKLPLMAVASALVTKCDVICNMLPIDTDASPRPQDCVLARWPQTMEEALSLASAAIGMLSIRSTGALLCSVSQQNPPPPSPVICWILREIRAWQPGNDAPKAAVVTTACAALARLGRASDLPAIMPEAWKTVMSVPAEYRGAALQSLHDLLRRCNAVEPWRNALAKAVQELPASDRPLAGGTKRKEPPA